MKAIMLVAALCLGSCAGPTAESIKSAASLPFPAMIANRTAADEQASIGVELAYKAFRTALEIGTDAGAFKGKRAVAVADVDNRVFAAVKAVRSAYRTANSSNFLKTAKEARQTIDQALSALKG